MNWLQELEPHSKIPKFSPIASYDIIELCFYQSDHSFFRILKAVSKEVDAIDDLVPLAFVFGYKVIAP